MIINVVYLAERRDRWTLLQQELNSQSVQYGVWNGIRDSENNCGQRLEVHNFCNQENIAFGNSQYRTEIKINGLSVMTCAIHSPLQRLGGATIDDVQEFLGQTNPRTAKRYVTSLPSEQKKITSARFDVIKRVSQAV